MFKEFVDQDKQMNQAREDIFINGARTNKVFKVELPREKIKEDLKKYVGATFLSVFRPDMKVTIPGQEPQRKKLMAPGAEEKQNKKDQMQTEDDMWREEFKLLKRPDRPPRELYFLPEQEFDDEVLYITPEMEEDFDIIEGRTFKGH